MILYVVKLALALSNSSFFCLLKTGSNFKIMGVSINLSGTIHVSWIQFHYWLEFFTPSGFRLFAVWSFSPFTRRILKKCSIFTIISLNFSQWPCELFWSIKWSRIDSVLDRILDPKKPCMFLLATLWLCHHHEKSISKLQGG